MRLSRSSVIVFAAAYAIIYVLAVQKNLALFTYHPELNQFGPLVQAPIEGPAMYWYGWLTTSGLGALAVAVIANYVPARLWSGLSWTVPIAAMAVMVYILRGYFLR
jgi:hypothetical protein